MKISSRLPRSGLLVAILLTGACDGKAPPEPAGGSRTVEELAAEELAVARELLDAYPEDARAAGILRSVSGREGGPPEQRRATALVLHAAGRVHRAHGRADRAEQLWRRALELDPACVPAISELARHCRRSGRIEEALRLCRDLIRMEPENPVHPMNSGVLLVELKRLDEAESTFRSVCRLAPKEATGYRELARVLLEAGGDAREAVSLARKAVSLRPDAPHWYLLSRALARAGERDGAREALEKAVELAPENSRYRQAREALEEDAARPRAR